MTRIGIFYGSTSGNTKRVAELVRAEMIGGGFSEDEVDVREDAVDVRDIGQTAEEDFAEYDVLILGAPTWHGGELQDDWEAFTWHLDAADLSGKTVALFGLGDQKGYPDAFLDALGTLYEHVKRKGANVIGRWPTHGYTFTSSSALVDGEFVGLAIDEENQPELTAGRVAKWVKRIRLELS
jgi:flavodoxin I